MWKAKEHSTTINYSKHSVSNNSVDLSLVKCGVYTNEFYLTKWL